MLPPARARTLDSMSALPPATPHCTQAIAAESERRLHGQLKPDLVIKEPHTESPLKRLMLTPINWPLLSEQAAAS